MNTHRFHELVAVDIHQRAIRAIHTLYGPPPSSGGTDVEQARGGSGSKVVKYRRQKRNRMLRRMIVLSLAALLLVVTFGCAKFGRAEFGYYLGSKLGFVQYAEPGLGGHKQMRGYKVQVVSEAHPRLLLVEDFLTDIEADRLRVGPGGETEEEAGVLGKLWHPMARGGLSFGRWLDDSDDIVDNVRQRVGDFTGLPEQQGEPLLITRSLPGYEEPPHYDYMADTGDRAAGARVGTFVMFLSDSEGHGGEFAFPRLAAGAVKIRPRKGAALLWLSCELYGGGRDWTGQDPPTWPLRQDVGRGAGCSKRESGALHGLLPVHTGGEAWIATFWIHERPFGDP